MRNYTPRSTVPFDERKVKVCPRCNRRRLRKSWNIRKDGSFTSYCKFCERKRVGPLVKKYDERDRVRLRATSLKRHHGITFEEYEALLAEQDGKCAICGSEGEFPKEIGKPLLDTHQLVVDHNHVTGKIRGLLCWRCNLGLGHLQDNLSTLRSAVEYLEKSDS